MKHFSSLANQPKERYKKKWYDNSFWFWTARRRWQGNWHFLENKTLKKNIYQPAFHIVVAVAALNCLIRSSLRTQRWQIRWKWNAHKAQGLNLIFPHYTATQQWVSLATWRRIEMKAGHSKATIKIHFTHLPVCNGALNGPTFTKDNGNLLNFITQSWRYFFITKKTLIVFTWAGFPHCCFNTLKPSFPTQLSPRYNHNKIGLIHLAHAMCFFFQIVAKKKNGNKRVENKWK